MQTFTIISFSELAQQEPLRWPVPMSEKLADSTKGEFVWRRLQFVFPLKDPRQVAAPSLSLPDDEKELLRQYVSQATKLAQTSLLAADDFMCVTSPHSGAAATVEVELSAPDVTVGFMTMLRQCYAPGEEASFNKAQKVLGRRLHEVGAVSALIDVKCWRKAHAALKNQALEELVQEELVTREILPAESMGPEGRLESNIVREPASPDEMLRTLWYGDQIHWGSNRAALRVIQAEPFTAARWEVAARQAAVDLAHFYVGFAVLVESLMGEAEGADETSD